ncbi:MAG: GntR family transcriptional regulator [Pseudomonadota bacterium]
MVMDQDLTARNAGRPGLRPLYQQVRDLFRARISSGAWRPAEALPSEQSLAAELGVSQGTVRKALDSLAADNLVERRQGKGTFVTQHTAESAHFRFFKLCGDDGERVLPACKSATIARRAASREERRALDLSPRVYVYEITRTRFIEEQPTLRETIVVSAAQFPNLDAHQPLPNTLYTFYQAQYGVSIVRAGERLRAVAADKADARAFGVAEGAPLLEAERIAFDLDRAPVERRVSRYLTDGLHYAADMA